MDFSKNINFNHVFIIDLLKESELQTARRLDESISVFIPSNQRTHITITSREALLVTLQQIKLKEIPEGMRPIIHIEGHGCEQSLSLSNGSSIKWGELYDVLSEINRALNNTLILFIATCYGFHYINTLSVLASTPTYCLISPYERITSGDIERGTSMFYKDLFETKDLDHSINNLIKHNPCFDFYNSDQFFIGLMIKYFKEGHYGKSSRARIERLISESFIEDESNGYVFSRNEKRAMLAQRRRSAKEFIKSEGSRFDIYKRNSLKFLGNYDKITYGKIIKEIEG
jgi:hypothetical protein